MDARAGAVEANRELEPFDAEGDEKRAGAGRLDLHLLQRLALERGERFGDLGGALRERAPTGEPAKRLQGGLLAFGTVDAADAPALEAELDQLLEGLRLVLAQLTFLHGRDEVRKAAAPLAVLDE